MATDHNFKVKNGLTVLGDTLVVNHTGDLSGTQVYIKYKDSNTNLMRWGEGTSGQSTYRFRIDQNFKFIGNSGSGDNIILDSDTGNIRGTTFNVGSTQIIDSSRNLTNIGTISSGAITSGAITTTDHISLPVAKRLYFGGGSHTYISEDIDDRLRFFVGGAEFMRFSEDTNDSAGIYVPTTFTSDVTINGSLSVLGTTTTIDTANLNVEDNNITLNYSTGDSSASANGAGITIQDAVSSSTDATILWDATNNEFDFSHAVNINGKITANNEIRLDNGTGGTTHLNYQDGGSNYIRGTTTYIDTLLDLNSNNITDVGTISSGAITSTSSVYATEFDLPSGGTLDWANGDARIVEGLVNNYSLSFQTYDGSNITTALRLDGDNTSTSSGIAQFQRDVRSAGQVRATGWWNESATTDYTGLAFEIGKSGSTAFAISYDRSTSQYGPMQFNATDFTFNNPVIISGSGSYLRTATNGIYGKMSDEWHTANALRGGNFSADIGNDTTVLTLFPASPNDESGNARAANDYSTGIKFMHLDPDNSTWGSSYQGGQAWIGLKVDSTPGQELSSFVIATNDSSTAGTFPTERLKIDKNGVATFTNQVYATRFRGSQAVHHGSTGYWKTRDNGGGSEYVVEYSTSDTLADVNIEWKVTNAGHATATGSSRAPIFYDSDNTDFYVNPVGSSKLYGTLYLGHTNTQPGTLVIYDTGNNGMEIKGTGANNFQFDMIGTSSTGSILFNDFNGRFTGNLTVNSNLYIGDGDDGYFYNDTNGRIAFAGGDFYIQNSVSNYYNYATNQYIGDSSGDNIYFRGNTLTGTSWTINPGDMRSPIYYDSANTAYYLDPNGTSHLERWWTKDGGNNTTAPRWDTSAYVLQSTHWYGHTNSQGMYLGESGNDIYLRGQLALGSTTIQGTYGLTVNTGGIHAGNLSIDYVSQLHFNDNVRFLDEGNDSYLRFKYGDTGAGGIKFYNGSDALQGYVYASGGGDFGLLSSDGSWSIQVNNSVNYAYHQLRSPIFYDMDDTAYYIDAASTSVTNDLRGLNIQAGTSSTLSSRGTLAVYRSANPFISFHDATTSRTAYFQETGGRFLLGEVSYTESVGSFRAPLFYDTDDTNYYINPSISSSKIVGLNIHAGSNDNTNDAALYINKTSNADWGIKLSGTSSSTEYGIMNDLAGTHSYNYRALNSGSEYSRLGTDLFYHNSNIRAPVFYDHNDTNYYIHLDQTSDSIRTAGTIHIGAAGHLGFGDLTNPKLATPGYAAAWGGHGSTTGQVIIMLPGNLSNYDMLYFEVDVYEYSSKNATKIVVGGHNWNSGGNSGTGNQMWHNTGVKVIGDMDKPIYFGWYNDGNANRRVMVLGEHNSSWSYATVRVSNVSGATDFYSGSIDYTGNWNVIQNSTSGSYTRSPSTNFNSTGEKTLKTHGRMAAYGYTGNGNVGGTGEASWHPSGIYSNGNNWLYGSIYLNNNSINNASDIRFGSTHDHELATERAQNIRIRTGSTNAAAGIVLQNDSGSFVSQWYGDGTNYGFLDGTWANWDIKKVTNGEMYFNGDNTYYLRPDSLSIFNGLRTNYVGANRNGSNTAGDGLALYGNYSGGEPTYGMMFSGRASYGGHGSMGASDWATYFTMNNDTSRGWIFRRVGTGNSASITAGGRAQFDDSVRSPAFYDTNDTSYYLDPTSTGWAGLFKGSVYSYQGGFVSDNYGGGGLRVTNPGGASMSNNGSTQTGAITIKLPVDVSNTMLRMTIKIYEYSTNESFEVHCGGYYYSGPTWQHNPFAYIIGNPSTDRNFNVRFGHDGSVGCIYIGETNSTWSYVQVFVTDFQAGYSGFSASNFDNDWDVTMSTSFSNVTATISNCQVGRYASIFYDASNTSYYVDPSSASATNDFRAVNVQAGTNTVLSSRGTLAVYRSANPFISFHDGGVGRTAYLQETGGKFLLGEVDFTESAGSFRAPIFYDTSSTNYYIDPGSNSQVEGRFTIIQGGSGRDHGIYGSYDPTKLAHIWSMGTAYSLGSGGTKGNLYGMSYSYNPDYQASGNNPGAISGLGHQFQWRANGDTQCAFGTGIYTVGNITAYSDRRVKTNIEIIPNALEKVCKLNGYTFERTDLPVEDPDGNPLEPLRQTGVIAQEVLEVLPEAVTGSEEKHYSVAYGNMVGILIEAIKEQQNQIEELKAQVKSLKEN